ncbi:hypothetical protein SAMN05216174_1338 [Actinokineospora iranica]|uniref:Uncharacterized protein n=1 Tax=Actinokineospora iranica TaxID=1271860 RepID=A0A1G6ZIY6_9PSEU|nr:hypothetical protein SAMN05216174_1338 [Actinokineospora iranica]
MVPWCVSDDRRYLQDDSAARSSVGEDRPASIHGLLAPETPPLMVTWWLGGGVRQPCTHRQVTVD